MARSRSPIPQAGVQEAELLSQDAEGEEEQLTPQDSPAAETRYDLRKLEGERFPWSEVAFCVYDKVAENEREVIEERIQTRGGSLVQADDAEIIVATPSTLQSAAQESTSTIVRHDWLMNVYYTGIGQPSAVNAAPLLVSGDGVPMVSVPEGDETWRLTMIAALECNGALVVPYEQSNLAVLPEGKSLLGGLDRVRHVNERLIWDELGDTPPAQPPTPRPRAARQKRQRVADDDSYTPRKRGARTARTRPVGRSPKKYKDPPTQIPRTRINFTEKDRDKLARFLAYQRPSGPRGARSLYENILPKYQWAERHPWQSWHEHYRKSKDHVGPDGMVLEEMIERYVKAGVGAKLRTKAEERAREEKRAAQKSGERRRQRTHSGDEGGETDAE